MALNSGSKLSKKHSSKANMEVFSSTQPVDIEVNSQEILEEVRNKRRSNSEDWTQ